jgi:hypothetical protein
MVDEMYSIANPGWFCRRMWINLLCPFLLAAQPAMADRLLDFTLFSPPEVSQRRIAEPVVSWLVHPQASGFCQQASPKDGFVSRAEGCVYWQTQASRCTIVTTEQTTHSQLGHLFVHCLQAR